MPQCSRGTKYLAHLNLGGAHEALGHYDEAVRNYQEALNHAGDEGERTAIKACLLMVCGQPGPSQGTEIVPGATDLLRKLGIPGF